MESQVSPKTIETRVEAMAATEQKVAEDASKAPEAKVPETKEPEVKAPDAKAPEAKAPEAKSSETKAPEVKVPEVKEEKKKQPNDPAELRKWSTKLSQENATLREEMKGIKTALEKLSKKPVDYVALAKDPDALHKQIEAERQEAVADLKKQLAEKHEIALTNETVVERMRREHDTENYPRWGKLFPLIQTLANNQDGRINWNNPAGIGVVLDEVYALADQLSPAETPAAPVVPPVEQKSVEKTMTQAEVDALIAKAKADTRAEIEAGISAEKNGAGIGSQGKGGRRDTKVSKEALMKLPLEELKKVISQE